MQTWVSLAEYCLKDENWSRVRKNCFNDRRNPEDDELDTQIVKVFFVCSFSSSVLFASTSLPA